MRNRAIENLGGTQTKPREDEVENETTPIWGQKVEEVELTM